MYIRNYSFQLIFILFLLFSFCNAQPGSIDFGFGHVSSMPFADSTRFFNNTNDFVLDPNGNIIVVGDLSAYNSHSCERIAKITYNGILDTTFAIGASFNDEISKIIIQSNGQYVVCGKFTSCFSKPMNGIARLNSDGSLDTTFQTIGSGFNNPEFKTLIRDQNGRYILGGNFIDYNGIAVNNIIRFTPAGLMDTTFHTGYGIQGTVYSIREETSGNYIVAGSITGYDTSIIGNYLNNIIRLYPDGIRDTIFPVGTGFNSMVTNVEILPGGKILCAGWFIDYSGESISNLCRLNSDATLDTTFHQQLPGFSKVDSTPTGLFNMSVLPNGKIIVIGNFDHYGNDSLSGIALFNQDGTNDTTFNSRKGFLVSNPDLPAAKVLTEQSGSFLVMTKNNADYANYKRNKFVRLNSTGIINDNYFNINTGFFGSAPTRIAGQSDGKLIITGSISDYDGYYSNGIVRLNSNGTPDTSFYIGDGITMLPGKIPNDVIVQPDGKIIIVGGFNVFNNHTVNGIVRLLPSGRIDPAFQTGSGFSALLSMNVNCIALQNDGKIIVAGYFDNYNGNTVNNILRLDSTGNIDPSFNIGTGPDGIISAISVQPNGKIIVGGNFQNFNSISHSQIVRLNNDGTIDNSFSGSVSGTINRIILSGAQIIACGQIYGCGSSIAHHIVKMNSDGSVDSVFTNNVKIDGINPFVYDIALLPSNRLVAVGDFINSDTTILPSIVYLKADGTIDYALQVGAFYGVPLALYVQPDHKIVAAGGFSLYIPGGNANGIIRLNATPNNCSSYYTIYPDTVPHHYLAINLSTGSSPLSYSWDWGDGSANDTSAYPVHSYAGAGFYSICLTITDANSCSDTYCNSYNLLRATNPIIFISVVPALTNSMQNINEDLSCQFFPNPFHDELNFELINNESTELTLFDISSRKLISQTFINSFSINTELFAKGIYIFELRSKDGDVRKGKVIKH
jgi:uncharacterized delta-60 repeat protein